MSKHTEILQKYSVRAKKSFGQNFLVNDGILEKIATATGVEKKNIIEVGPGYGALTERLLDQKPESLTLVELDPDMVAILESRVADRELRVDGVDFEIVSKDVLKFEPRFEKYSVIANIPYYITSPILHHFLYDVVQKPEEMIILLQRDVGDKIRKVGGNKHSVLSLFVDLACESVEEICRVSAGSFVPAPKVESAVLRFVVRKDMDVASASHVLDLVKMGFAEKRKKLLSNLSKGLKKPKEEIMAAFLALGLHENVRAEELGPELWTSLADVIFR